MQSIKVGIPVSLTGQFSLQGKQTLAGIQAWAGDMNRSGGLILGGRALPVELIWHDDGSRRENVRAVTVRLILEDAVDLLVGPYSAVLTNAAAEVAGRYEKLLWNQGGASPTVYEQGNPWVVGILTPADEYLSGLLPAVREVEPGASTLAIVRAATGAFPRDVVAGVERSVTLLGFHTVFSTEFDGDEAEFVDVIRQVRQAAPDVLVAVGRFQNDLNLALRLAEERPSIGAVALVAAGIDAFRDWLDDKAENFVGPSQWEPQGMGGVDYGPSVEEVRASLCRAGYPVVDYPMAQAYAVGVVMQRCVEECGGVGDMELRRVASSLDFSTFYGRFLIDSRTGRPTGKPAVLVQWRKGRKVIVWPPEHRTGLLAHPWRK